MNKTPEVKDLKLEQLLRYAKNGWAIFPLMDRGKKPRPNSHGFKDASTNPKQIAAWRKQYPKCNWGMATGKISGQFVVDVDQSDGGIQSWKKLCGEHEPINTLTVITGGEHKGEHLHFNLPEGVKIKSCILAEGVEIKSDGKYVLIPPSFVLEPYTFASKAKIADAPLWLLEKLDGHSPSSKKAGTYTPLGKPLTKGNRNESLFHSMLAQAREGVDKDLALASARTWAKDQPDIRDTEIVTTVENAYERNSRKKDMKDYCFRQEAGDADLFALLNRDRVIFVHAEKAWYFWNGNYWERDDIRRIYGRVTDDLAGEYIYAGGQAIKAGAEKKDSDALFKRARMLMNRYRADNVLHLAAGEEGMGITGNEWDTNPMLLGVNNGVIDLVTGEFRTGLPREYLRAHSPIDWRGMDCPAPVWKKFLLGITEDPEMVDFMQRLFGYCITGLTTDHIFPVLWGEHGFNGKGTLLETLANVLGEDLAMPTPPETLMVKKQTVSGTNTALMAFQGKRLVWASESKEGQRIDAGLVKNMTGGDTIVGNEKYEKQKRFKATHKIMLITNHKPHIKADDQALLDRLLTLDFQLHFCDEPKEKNERKIDRDMPAKLEAEASGILAWLVRGCLEWQAGGLCPTTRVKAANVEYKTEEDDVGEFIQDELKVAPNKSVLASEVYRVYKGWANKNGMQPMSAQALHPKLEDRFGKRIGTGGMRTYSGIELLHPRADWSEKVVDLER
jgi:putative DNA primase/helicase